MTNLSVKLARQSLIQVLTIGVAYSIRVGEVAGIRQPGGQVVVGGPKMVIILLLTVLWTKQMVVGGPYKMANTYVGG